MSSLSGGWAVGWHGKSNWITWSVITQQAHPGFSHVCGKVQEKDSRNMRGLWRPGLGTGVLPLPLYSTGQRKLRDSRPGGTSHEKSCEVNCNGQGYREEWRIVEMFAENPPHPSSPILTHTMLHNSLNLYSRALGLISSVLLLTSRLMSLIALLTLWHNHGHNHWPAPTWLQAILKAGTMNAWVSEYMSLMSCKSGCRA